MKELTVTIFIDSDHDHDKVTGRSVTGMICFVGRTPISYMAKRQSSVQTPTFGAEFVALKKAVEGAVTIRYYLQTMGIKVSKPTIIYGDNLSAIIHLKKYRSPLKKNILNYHTTFVEKMSVQVWSIFEKLTQKKIMQMHL